MLISDSCERTGHDFCRCHHPKTVLIRTARLDTYCGQFALLHVPVGHLIKPGIHELTNARDYLDFQTKEIPWIASSTTAPQPCYTDNNISVYAIPVLSHPSSSASRDDTTPLAAEESSSTSDLHQKRKRDPSSDTPRKRLNPGSMAPGRMVLSDELLAEVRKRDVDPGSLSGPSAEEFRRMVIKAMFPNTKQNPALDEEVRRANKKKSKQGVLKALGKGNMILHGINYFKMIDHFGNRQGTFSLSR